MAMSVTDIIRRLGTGPDSFRQAAIDTSHVLWPVTGKGKSARGFAREIADHFDSGRIEFDLDTTKHLAAYRSPASVINLGRAGQILALGGDMPVGPDGNPIEPWDLMAPYNDYKMIEGHRIDMSVTSDQHRQVVARATDVARAYAMLLDFNAKNLEAKVTRGSTTRLTQHIALASENLQAAGRLIDDERVQGLFLKATETQLRLVRWQVDSLLANLARHASEHS